MILTLSGSVHASIKGKAYIGKGFYTGPFIGAQEGNLTDQLKRLKALRQMEYTLERAWQDAAWREDWIETARIKREYKIVFDELLNLCKQMKII